MICGPRSRQRARPVMSTPPVAGGSGRSPTKNNSGLQAIGPRLPAKSSRPGPRAPSASARSPGARASRHAADTAGSAAAAPDAAPRPESPPGPGPVSSPPPLHSPRCAAIRSAAVSGSSRRASSTSAPGIAAKEPSEAQLLATSRVAAASPSPRPATRSASAAHGSSRTTTNGRPLPASARLIRPPGWRAATTPCAVPPRCSKVWVTSSKVSAAIKAAEPNSCWTSRVAALSHHSAKRPGRPITKNSIQHHSGPLRRSPSGSRARVSRAAGRASPIPARSLTRAELPAMLPAATSPRANRRRAGQRRPCRRWWCEGRWRALLPRRRSRHRDLPGEIVRSETTLIQLQ